MTAHLIEPNESIQAVLGYLNFSSGSHDPHIFRHLSTLYQYCDQTYESATLDTAENDLWKRVFQLLVERLHLLKKSNSTFADPTQVAFILNNTRDELLPKYLEFHSDLLFHQSADTLFNPFFIGRLFECLLTHAHHASEFDATWNDHILSKLNDYVGYRPVAVLENERKMQPYPHEWCRPIPLFVRGAGVAYGAHANLIGQTLELLRSVPAPICSAAQFDLENMMEMAIDPRPYDFDHPVNKRPNYQFGLWDPLSVDSRGFYSRFVIQQVTLDILLQRVQDASLESRSQKMFESAAALAGTMLMASAVSGHGPDAYSSDVTLGNLLPTIAECRDAFYAHLMEHASNFDPTIAGKLAEEADRFHQPFGGVRRYLNAQLSRRRARQLEQMHLAKIFAQIGRPQAAVRQASLVPAVSTRIISAIECLLTEIESGRGQGRSAQAAISLEKAVDLVMRGIECGAIVDPWNILGFDSNFSLFPALENSIPDHRIGVLIEVIDRLLTQFAQNLCFAAAEKDSEAVNAISNNFNRFAIWWDQFATEWVGDVNTVLGEPIYKDAQIAAQSLAAWQQAGATSGDVRFWQPFVERIDSPKGYVLIIDALLDHKDFVAAMNLLMHWLSQSDHINLQKGSDLFHVVANRWLNEVLSLFDHSDNENAQMVWDMVAKFFDFLEANAGVYGQVPKWELISSAGDRREQALDPENETADELYSAAYDEVVYRDSTDDGVDGEILGSDGDHFGLAEEARRLSERLGFMVTTTRLWKHVVVTAMAKGTENIDSLRSRFIHWLNQAETRQKDLLNLLKAIEMCDLPQPLPTAESLVEYDRNRAIHEVLTERVIDTYLADAETIQVLFSAVGQKLDEDTVFKYRIAFLVRAAVKGDANEAQRQAAAYMKELPQQQLLYVPLARGGNTLAIAQTKGRQRSLKLALDILPRMGLINETISLLRCCAESEREQVGVPGCVTEFDQMFYVSNEQMITSVVASVCSWTADEKEATIGDTEDRDRILTEYLQQLVEHTAELWLEHSQTLRLSVLEKVYAEKKWNELVNFIKAHGKDIFTQTFLHLGNLRAILHRGVSLWLEEKATSSEEKEWSIYAVMDTDKNKRKIVEHLQTVIEALIENYGEYREYNGTTTQSDQGEMLYAFLDMLRLRSSYDRVAWNLVPAMQVHEILLRHGCVGAAEFWRVEMMQRTAETAAEMVKKLRELEQRHGMQLSTISDRLEERFVRPLEIGRAKMLLQKCLDRDSCQKEEWFSLLEEQIDELTQEPTGAGLDLPQWIATLEEEVHEYKENNLRRIREDITEKVSRRLLSQEELGQELQRLE